MNTSITIGLYDFLNMVVMGFLILHPVVNFPTDAVSLSWFVPCYIVGLIYHKLMENTFGVCLRNKDGMISQAYKSVNKIKDDNFSSKNYYKAYYFLMEKRLLGYIPILEAQAAFLRNLLLVPIYYCFFADSFSIIQEKWIFILVSILFTILIIPFLWYKTQMKIHELVWEGKKYLGQEE